MRLPLGPPGPPPEELPIGRVFGQYKILSAIQRGGMGELFLAERIDKRAPQNKVVLKRLLADYLEDERYVRMFRSEAKVMSSLDHPNIVKVFDVPVIDGKQCLAMEYVHGRNLAQILRRCRELNTAITPQVALHIISEVLLGLDYAHNFVLDDGRPLGLVHRDVTPPNILVSFDGAVKITDFGIAKSEMSSVSTTVGVVKGTTRYLAPEQIRGQPATPRSDCFSAAVVLVESLTGQALFDHGTVPPTLFAIVTGQRPPISEVLPFPAPRLAAALEKVLDLHPERRFRTAREFGEVLEVARRELGSPIDRSGLSIFIKELFRGSDSNDFAEELGPWQLDAMDLTYLFEVQELGAFKQEPVASPFADRSAELERVKALLKAAVPGASPLDADQFRPSSSSSSPPKTGDLVEGLHSHTGLRSVPREETKVDRPKPTSDQENVPAPDPLHLAETGDVFSDPSLTVEDGIQPSHRDDSVEVFRIDPASLPQARIVVKSRVIEDPTRTPREIPRPAPPPKPKPKPSRALAVVTFLVGLALGAGAWSQVGRLQPMMPPSMPSLDPWPARESSPARIARPVYPSLQQQRATAYEGVRPGSRSPVPDERPALLTVKKPAGARVRLNGTWLGEKTPLIDYAITPGEVKIELVKKKLKKRYRIDAQPGEKIDLNRRGASQARSE